MKIWAPLVLGGVLACAHAPPAPTTTSLWTPGWQRDLQVQGDQLASPDIQLKRVGDAWQGVAYRQSVQLEGAGDKLTGNVGQQRVELTVTPQGDAVDARGLFAGQLNDFQLSPTKLDGRIRLCSYSLWSKDGVSYNGQRTCNGGHSFEWTTVRLSAEDTHPLSAPQLAPLLVLLSR